MTKQNDRAFDFLTLEAPEALFRHMSDAKLTEYRQALVADQADDPTNARMTIFVNNRVTAIARILAERAAKS